MLRYLLSLSPTRAKNRESARVVYHREEKTRDAAFSCAPIWTLRIFQMSILAHKIYTSEIIFTSQTATCLNLIHRLAYKLSIFLVHTIELSRAGREKNGRIRVIVRPLQQTRLSPALSRSVFILGCSFCLFYFAVCTNCLQSERQNASFDLCLLQKIKCLLHFCMYISCVSAAVYSVGVYAFLHCFFFSLSLGNCNLLFGSDSVSGKQQ